MSRTSGHFSQIPKFRHHVYFVHDHRDTQGRVYPLGYFPLGFEEWLIDAGIPDSDWSYMTAPFITNANQCDTILSVSFKLKEHAAMCKLIFGM